MGYFFVTDTNPFDDRLREILHKYQDPRLVYTPIPRKYKIPVSIVTSRLLLLLLLLCVCILFCVFFFGFYGSVLFNNLDRFAKTQRETTCTSYVYAVGNVVVQLITHSLERDLRPNLSWNFLYVILLSSSSQYFAFILCLALFDYTPTTHFCFI